MAFYIYYHWHRDSHYAFNHSLIHKAECRFCNNGQGLRTDKEEGKRGQWSSSFETYKEAKRTAGTLGDKSFEIKDCQKCKPN